MGSVLVKRRSNHKNAGPDSPLTQTEISNPLLRQQYICLPLQNTCQLELTPSLFQPSAPPASGVNTARVKPGGVDRSQPLTKSLGTQIIEGLQTIGTRETSVISTGEIGNDGPVVATREFWFSSKLGFNLIPGKASLV